MGLGALGDDRPCSDVPAHGGAVRRLGVRSDAEDGPEVALRGQARQVLDAQAPRERQEAAVAGQPALVTAWALGDHAQRGGEEVPHLLRRRQIGEVAGATRHHVMEQERLAYLSGLPTDHGSRHRRYFEMVRLPADPFPQTVEALRRPGWAPRTSRRESPAVGGTRRPLGFSGCA